MSYGLTILKDNGKQSLINIWTVEYINGNYTMAEDVYSNKFKVNLVEERIDERPPTKRWVATRYRYFEKVE